MHRHHFVTISSGGALKPGVLTEDIGATWCCLPTDTVEHLMGIHGLLVCGDALYTAPQRGIDTFAGTVK